MILIFFYLCYIYDIDKRIYKHVQNYLTSVPRSLSVRQIKVMVQVTGK